MVLTGDNVSWLNGSFRDHTVTARDGLFDSASWLAHGLLYTFSTPGTYLYAARSTVGRG